MSKRDIIVGTVILLALAAVVVWAVRSVYQHENVGLTTPALSRFAAWLTIAQKADGAPPPSCATSTTRGDPTVRSKPATPTQAKPIRCPEIVARVAEDP